MTTPTVSTPVSTESDSPTYERLLAAVTDPEGREILDPATGEVVGRVAFGSPEDLDAAVARVRAAQPAWGARSDSERIDLLQRAADAIEVRLNGELISCPPFGLMYWTAAQQLAHMTVNGASLRTGDLYASGTVSGPQKDQRGSFIELSWGGKEPLALADGSTRTFLEDGDVVTLTATAPGAAGGRISLGEVTGRVEPSPSTPTEGPR